MFTLSFTLVSDTKADGNKGEFTLALDSENMGHHDGEGMATGPPPVLSNRNGRLLTYLSESGGRELGPEPGLWYSL